MARDDEKIENAASKSTGIYQAQAQQQCAPVQDNCNCRLDGALCAGTTGEYDAGSYAYTSAHNTELPDKLYIVDAVSCRDETSCANEDYARQDVGTHTFQIEGQITVSEKYDQTQNNQRQGREKANGCAHKEQKIRLQDNIPCPIDVPCVCANKC